MLTFDDGKTPIALIKGGELNKKIIYITDKQVNCCLNHSNVSCVTEVCCSKCPITKMRRDMLATKTLSKETQDEIINIMLKDENKSKTPFSELEVKDGKITPLLNPNETERIYICGASGCGKSYLVASLVKDFLKIKPDTPIYLFSDVPEDKVLDDIKNIFRIDLQNMMVNTEHYRESICIFDDIDGIQDKKLLKAVFALRNDMARRGRHEDITLIATSHLITDYNQTRIILNECSSVVVFPKSGADHQILYLLKKYLGFSKALIDKVLNIPSRHVYIRKQFPLLLISDTKIEQL